jgi:hypothetical protein
MQDENRHGDFFAAVLKARPEYLNDWKAKLWSLFFCHSVYITMYLNDHQRSSFYESVGLNTTQFNQHVILETNNSTARLFPAVRFQWFCLEQLRLTTLRCLVLSYHAVSFSILSIAGFSFDFAISYLCTGCTLFAAQNFTVFPDCSLILVVFVLMPPVCECVMILRRRCNVLVGQLLCDFFM